MTIETGLFFVENIDLMTQLLITFFRPLKLSLFV